MPPEPFGGGGDTVLHPAALAILVLTVLLIWLVPRKYVVVPFLITAILVPLGQQVLIVGVHFTVLRLLVLSVWIRLLPSLLSGRETLVSRVTAVDKAFIFWVLSAVATYTLLWADLGALVVKLGFLYNAFGIYFLFRHLIRDREDSDRVVRTLAAICLVLAVLMASEQLTARNSFLGLFGAPADTLVRAGHVRSRASFLTSITAGTCGALMLPVFIGLGWSSVRLRGCAALGALSATVMTVTSASSTPVVAYFAGIAGLCMWPIRRHMKAIRWVLVFSLLALHVAMKAPVWALINRIDFTGSSTSWHRFSLVDQFVRRFADWWLLGTKDNADWGFGMWDAVNWYVASGISGGLIGLTLFAAIIVYSFKSTGKSMKSLRASVGDYAAERFMWSLGAALFAASTAFFGIALFDQSIVFWYALVAIVVAMSSATQERLSPGRERLESVISFQTSFQLTFPGCQRHQA